MHFYSDETSSTMTSRTANWLSQNLVNFGSRVYETFRRNGLSEGFQQGLQFVNLNYQGYLYHLNYLQKRRQRSYVFEADPYQIIKVDPDLIKGRPAQNWDKWWYLGDVVDGDWDEETKSFEQTLLYQAIECRIKRNTPWEETERYQNTVKRIEQGESTWNGCLSKKDVRRRCAHIDSLVESIRTNGFKSQSEIHGKPNRQIVLSRKFDRSQTDVVVHIGRDGTIFFCDGRHRFSISKTLGLDSIPVRVVTRHRQWQEIREEIGNADSIEDIPDHALRHKSHPDVQKLFDRYF